MALAHSTGQKNGTLDGSKPVKTTYNSGTIRLLTGTAPSTSPAADQAETGTTLVDVTLPATLYPAPASGVLTANAISSATIAATGTAGYGRAKISGGTTTSSSSEARIQFAVATSGSDMNLNTLSLVSGGTFSITAGPDYTHPA